MMSFRIWIRRTWIVASLVLLAACGTSREVAEPTEEADELPTPAANMADYEDFDPTPYEEAPAAPAADLQHDVPERLMEGRADEGVRSEVQGFRVQLHSSLDKSAAVEIEEEVKQWWRAENETAPAGLFSAEIPVYNVYIQPYYRVRVGNFRSRQAAERARQFLAQRFPDAFIVPDTVQITR